jgi:uncharacterized protein
MLRLVAFLVFALPGLALAQSWPIHENTYVNDYAGIIEEGAEGRITSALKSLRSTAGVEATVLTLHTRRGYATEGSFEDFATGLFNNWGIGNAERNDGILILVISQDREMRVELGAGYSTAFNREAQDIIDRIFLPAFRDGDFTAGIEDGTGAVIARIAEANAAGEEPTGGSGNSVSGIIGAIIGAVLAVAMGAAIFGRRIRDRFSHCPECGTRGIRTERHTLDAATRSSTGRGEKTTSCRHCGYHGTTFYTIPRITRSTSSSSGGSFGGGSSSGGGASGRW